MCSKIILLLLHRLRLIVFREIFCWVKIKFFILLSPMTLLGGSKSMANELLRFVTWGIL